MTISKRPKPAGTSPDRRTARDDGWAADVRTTIKKLQASGMTSIRGIAAALNDAGIRTRRGKQRWQAIQVRRMLARLTVPIVPAQCFIARTALGWTVSDVARAAGTSRIVVRNFERGDASRATTVRAIQSALESAGVVFIDANHGGPGARLLAVKMA
jgi:hypothetical protein